MSRDRLHKCTSPTAFFCKMMVDISFPVETCTITNVWVPTICASFIEVPPATAWVQPDHSGVTWFSRDELPPHLLPPRPHSLRTTKFQTNFYTPSVQRTHVLFTIQGGELPKHHWLWYEQLRVSWEDLEGKEDVGMQSRKSQLRSRSQNLTYFPHFASTQPWHLIAKKMPK